MVEPGPTSDNDFLSAILTPGSSLNPTFLLAVDGVLALLALTLVSLIVVSGGNSVHPIALLLIELALWITQRLHRFVNELQKTETETEAETETSPQSSETKKTL